MGILSPLALLSNSFSHSLSIGGLWPSFSFFFLPFDFFLIHEFLKLSWYLASLPPEILKPDPVVPLSLLFSLFFFFLLLLALFCFPFQLLQERLFVVLIVS